MKLQVVDLAPVPPEELADPEWSPAADKLVRSTYPLSELSGVIRNRVDFSSDPVKGPIGIRYGKADGNMYLRIKKVMLVFE